MAGQIVQFIFFKAIGVMVGAYGYESSFCDPGLLQLIQQVFHCPVEFNLGGHICPSGLGIGQILDKLLILYGHMVAHEIILHMTAYGHIIGMEEFIV